METATNLPELAPNQIRFDWLELGEKHPIHCVLTYEPAEGDGPHEPYFAGSCEVVAAYVGNTDILELLSPRQCGWIEEAAVKHYHKSLAEEAAERAAENAIEAREALAMSRTYAIGRRMGARLPGVAL